MPDDALRLQDQLIKQMTPLRKIQISEALRYFAWQAKAGWIRSQHPERTDGEVQYRVRAIFANVRD